MAGTHVTTIAQWHAALQPVRRKVYELLDGAIACGPYDGGCMAVAHALQSVIGGEVVVLVRPDDTADHAGVRVGDLLWDFGGPRSERSFIDRFNQQEHEAMGSSTRCVAVRPIVMGDLEEARRDPTLELRMAEAFAQILLPAAELDVWRGRNLQGTPTMTSPKLTEAEVASLARQDYEEMVGRVVLARIIDAPPVYDDFHLDGEPAVMRILPWPEDLVVEMVEQGWTGDELYPRYRMELVEPHPELDRHMPEGVDFVVLGKGYATDGISWEADWDEAPDDVRLRYPLPGSTPRP